MQQWNDTIIALSTPPGIGAIGVIRLSGPQAFNAVNDFFQSKNLLEQPSHTLHVGWLKDGEKMIDEVVVALYKGPRSYTGEDVVEISAHGSPFILQQILDLFLAHGIRLAKPGEFTLRAFLGGKMDLAQAEAVADLIASHSAASHKASLHQMRGGFSAVLRELRDQLIQFGALVELELDFATEDVEFADRTKLFALVRQLQHSVDELVASFRLGNVIKNGVQVAIIGKPNAGKSTLLNTLLNENRAIVSEIPGTTRDSIEEVLNIEGILFRLIDTAGIRLSKGDRIEDIGIERSMANAAKADIIIHLVDMCDDDRDPLEWLNQYIGKTIVVHNKYDIWYADLQKKGMPAEPPEGIYISAKDGEGIEELKNVLYQKVIEGKVQAEDTIVTNARHFGSLQEVSKSLSDIAEGMQNGLPGDLLALDIRRCLHYLGEITGQITNEDQLDYIFSKFCIGK